MATFDAHAVAESVRHRLWRYLAATAAPADIASVTEALFELRPGEVRRLAAAHVALSDEARSMLETMPRLLRELPSSVTRSHVETRGHLRPPVDWAGTLRRRAQTRDPSWFVSHPPERGYDTALGRLALLALRRCSDLSEVAALGTGGPVGYRLAEIRAHAAHLLAHRKLREVTAVEWLPERTLTTLRRYRNAGPAITFTRLAHEAVVELSPRIVHEVVTRRLLSPRETDRLFELYAGFRIVDGLVDAGFHERLESLVPTTSVPFARLSRGERNVTVWWQRSVWAGLRRDAAAGAYATTLRSAGMTRSTLRPDFLIVDEEARRALIVEVKLTEDAGSTRARDGIRDAMAYLYDARTIFELQPPPHALVIAWDADGSPAPAPVMVSDQDQIGESIASALERWGSQPVSGQAAFGPRTPGND